VASGAGAAMGGAAVKSVSTALLRHEQVQADAWEAEVRRGAVGACHVKKKPKIVCSEVDRAWGGVAPDARGSSVLSRRRFCIGRSRRLRE
jgi:hypothetical protein